jgi:hypothetical protein
MDKISPLFLVPKTLSADQPSIEVVVEALQKRTMWGAMRGALKKEKLPVGQGWKDLIANATESTSQGEKLRTFVHAYFADSIVSGERYVHLYQLSKEQTLSTLKGLNSAIHKNTVFSAKYPFPLEQKELMDAPSEPQLCEIRTLTNGDVSIIFCSARYYDDRDSYTFEQLPPQVQETYKQIEKLVTYRKIYYQAYDVVTIRSKLERVEVSIDQPEKSVASDLELLPLKVLSASALHVADLAGMGAKAPENLFSAIAGMYYQSTEGIVKALSFRTLTGSIKKERMTTSTADLRAEKFHHAGMNALGQKISPYELTLDLTFKAPEGHATLTLSALIRELSSATPTLHGCFVSATNGLSLELALNRLMTYVT